MRRDTLQISTFKMPPRNIKFGEDVRAASFSTWFKILQSHTKLTGERVSIEIESGVTVTVEV